MCTVRATLQMRSQRRDHCLDQHREKKWYVYWSDEWRGRLWLSRWLLQPFEDSSLFSLRYIQLPWHSQTVDILIYLFIRWLSAQGNTQTIISQWSPHTFKQNCIYFLMRVHLTLKMDPETGADLGFSFRGGGGGAKDYMRERTFIYEREIRSPFPQGSSARLRALEALGFCNAL